MRSRNALLAWLTAATATALVVPRQHPRRPPRLATADAVDARGGGAVPPLLRGKTPVEAVWTVAWPSVAIGLLRTALGQTDAWYIGRLGKNELEAMGAASFGVWLVYLLGEVGAVGVQALASESEGAGDRAGVGRVVVQGLYFCLLAAFISSLCSSQPIMNAYFDALAVKDATVRRHAASYLRATARWGVLPLCTDAVVFAGFKGLGETRAALQISAFTVFLNIGLNGPFIRKFGVAGAAHATSISAGAATLVALWRLGKRQVKLGRDPGPDAKTIKQITRVGGPVGASGALFTLVYVILGRQLSVLQGGAALAALAVGHRIEAISYTITEGYAVGVATVVGQWRGAGNDERAKEATFQAARYGALSMVPLSLLAFAFAPAAAHFFAPDPAVAGTAANYLRIVAWCFPFCAVEACFDGGCIGAQRTVPSMVLGVLGNGLRIPLAALFAARHGITGVWWAITLSTILKAPLKRWCFKRAMAESGTKN